MPKPIKRSELIRRLRELGYDGPYQKGKHPYMRRPDEKKVPIPNPHKGDIDWSLTKRILDQAGISKDEWDATEK